MSVLIFDIETILDPQRLADFHWIEWDFENKVVSQLVISEFKEKFWDRFDFMPEFHQIHTIVCWTRKSDGTLHTRALEWTEAQKIEEFFSISGKMNWKNLEYDLWWFNINNFDLPFIVKRAMFHKIKIPNHLKLFWKKPWDMENVIDLYDIYKHMWYTSWSLDLVCRFLKVPTPKGSIDWTRVQGFHDEWRDEEITEYCKRDVESTLLVYEYFKEMNFI